MSNLSLYDISTEFEALREMLENDGGEVTQDNEALEVYIQNLLTTKTDGCVQYIESQEDLINLAKEKITRLKNFIDSKENTIERFKNYVMSCMDRMQIKEVTGKLCQIKERKPSKVVVVEDQDKIPAEFVTVEVVTKVDKNKLKKAISEGAKIEGASLVDGKRSLMFKLRGANE